MMRARHSLRFARAPAMWPRYPSIFLSRKPTLVPEGGAVPRIEGQLADVRVDARKLATYAALCGAPMNGTLPIAYPHVLAMPLHVVMLGAEAFPVKLSGLVHVRNRIVVNRALPADEPAQILAWIEGHRDTERGHEFELHTAYVLAGDVAWEETSTFLARRRPSGASRPSARSASAPPDGVAFQTLSIDVAAGLGRRYALVSGDFNPIHLSNLTARAFGFPRAIAHGMWSLARVAAALAPEPLAAGAELAVEFKLPVFMPARLTLQRWAIPDGHAFTLREEQGERPHLTGTLTATR